jgi:hypothetical protein
MHKVGIDIGRSMVKATCNGEAVVEFPPLLAPVPAGGPVGLMDGRAERMEVLWEGTRWVLGEGVRGSWGARWITDERKIGTDTLALGLGALGRLGVQGEVTVCAGVPAALWGTDGHALRRLLSGPFAYAWNGHLRSATVAAYVLPEPVGTYFAWLLNPAGRVADPAQASYPVAVIDVGYRSVDIVLVEGGELKPYVTRSTAHGVVTAFNRLYAGLTAEVGLLSDDERMDAFLAVVRGEPLILKGREFGDEVRRVVDNARADLAEAVIGDCRSALSGANYRVALWTGGGAEWLRPELERAFPGGQWVQEPRLANVRGFYRFALWASARQKTQARAAEPEAGSVTG